VRRLHAQESDQAVSNETLIIVLGLLAVVAYLMLAVGRLQRQVRALRARADAADRRAATLALATKELGDAMHAVAASSHSYLAAVRLAVAGVEGGRPPTTH